MPNIDADVKAVFDAMPASMADPLMAARALVFAEAERLDVGPMEETLKWGQPAYLTARPRTGTTIRLAELAGRPALFVHCQTSIIGQARQVFDDAAQFHENRAVFLDGSSDAAAHVIAAALTYHER